MMDCQTVIANPEMIDGFQELIADADVVVIKRTVRVFANIYHDSFKLLSKGDLEETAFIEAWPSLKGVVDRLLSIITTCENEGVLVHLVRFLESSLSAHLKYDLSGKSEVVQRGREIVKKGLKALKDLVTTPYLGGSVFLVAVRTLINIACLRPDLYLPVTDLIGKQMDSLPPTLFDHDVRSVNKMLQKQLFKLLRRVETPGLKVKLIEMMVKVGVQRKFLAPWAPAIESKKRVPDYSEISDIHRLSPPVKKTKVDSAHDEEPNKLVIADEMGENIIKDEQSLYSKTNDKTRASSEEKSKICLNNLKTTTDKSKKEITLYDALNLPTVCILIFEGLKNLPSTIPEHFVKELDKKRLVHDDLNLMKERLASLLYNELSEANLIDELFTNNKFTKNENEDFNKFAKDPPKEKAVDSPLPLPDVKDAMICSSSSSSTQSTPSNTPPPLMDTDLRQQFIQRKVADVDMRLLDPRLANRDPRSSKSNNNIGPQVSRDPDMRILPLADPRLGGIRRDPRTENRSMKQESTQMEPMNNNRDHSNSKGSRVPTTSSSERKDPRLKEQNSSNNDPRNKQNGPLLPIPSQQFSGNMYPLNNPMVPVSESPRDPRIRPDMSTQLPVMFPPPNNMMPNFPPGQMPHAMMPGCPPNNMSWPNNNFNGNRNTLLPRPIPSGQRGFVPRAMLNM